jgi:hypothetical protein
VPVLGAAAVAGPVAPRGSPAPATDAVFSLGVSAQKKHANSCWYRVILRDWRSRWAGPGRTTNMGLG